MEALGTLDVRRSAHGRRSRFLGWGGRSERSIPANGRINPAPDRIRSRLTAVTTPTIASAGVVTKRRSPTP